LTAFHWPPTLAYNGGVFVGYHFLFAAADAERWVLLGIAGIVVLGIVAQWIAWSLRLPAILLLLASGIIVGPAWQAALGHKLIDPDLLLGHLLQPMVALSVAIVLFEGGLTLNFAELKGTGRAVWRLVTLGAIVSWLIASLAAYLLLRLPWDMSVLLGAILVVTGPTVIGPLLRHVKPTGEVGALLRWEGIIIDPIGAMLALLVFEAITTSGAGSQHIAGIITAALARTLVCGLAIGSASVALLMLVLRRFWVADQLQAPLTLMMVVAAFVGANSLQSESGLLAVTAMGIILSNQRFVPTAHILEFKESLSMLLIGALFIVLGSRLSADQITAIGWRTALFVLALIVIVRPASVWLSTLGTGVPLRSRLFLAGLAPRGIVAAAVSSVFALRLREQQIPGADELVPNTFAVIVATVSVYGLSARWLARRLGLLGSGSRGFLIAGAHLPARRIAAALREAGQEVLLVDTNRENINAAKMEGLPTFQGNILSEQLLRKIDGTSIGRLLALTANTDVNSLAVLHFARHFGRSQVFQLPHTPRGDGVTAKVKADVTLELKGRLLFDPAGSIENLETRLRSGEAIKRTLLTKEFGYDALQARAGGSLILMFVQDATGELLVNTIGSPLVPKPGQSVIALSLAAQPAPASAT
jgi:NhaP-type Na+/H+ or K+/H+ antiporter